MNHHSYEASRNSQRDYKSNFNTLFHSINLSSLQQLSEYSNAPHMKIIFIFLREEILSWRFRRQFPIQLDFLLSWVNK